MKAIGIDIGTTNICGIVINAETGAVEQSITYANDSFVHQNHPYERIQSVKKIVSIVEKILEVLPLKDVCAIGLTGQMHGIVYVDKNGNAVSPLYTWQDGRGNLSYKDTTYAEHLGSHTGYGNVTDFYNRENGFRPQNAVTYCTIADYIAMRLCGLKQPYIHDSNAASFGNYNIKTKTFDYDFNPKTTNEYTIIGEYKNIPVAAAIGDNQASVFSTLTNDDGVLVNVGTGSQVSVISSTPVESEHYEVRPYFENKYLIVGAALCGGRAYSVLKDFYKGIVQNFTKVTDDEIYSYMNNISMNINNSLSVDSRFSGSRENHELKGRISNITPENFTAENLTTALIEAIAVELRCECYHNKSNLKTSFLVGSGNGIRKNPNLIKNIEHWFQTIMNIPLHIEEAAYGAALYALVSAGKFKNAEDAHKIIKYQNDEKSEPLPLKIGERIASLRKLKGITQSELAELLLISNKAVSKWETGQGYPDITFLPKLAKIFNVTTDFLLGDDN